MSALSGGGGAQAAAESPGGDLGAVVEAELAEHPLHVVLGGALGHDERGRDLAIRQAARQQADDVALAAGQRLRGGLRDRWRRLQNSRWAGQPLQRLVRGLLETRKVTRRS